MKAIQIGGLAKNVLVEGTTGKVMGVTSSGVFLNSANKIFFLTSADYKSPYNIQIRGYNELAVKIAVGDQWQVGGEELSFSSHNIRIDINSAQVWNPVPQKNNTTTHVVQIERINRLMHRLRELDPQKGWLFLFDSGNSPIEAQDREALRIRLLTQKFLSGVGATDKLVCLESARSILGLGGGLTPSGDDWLTGFFLFHYRKTQAKDEMDPFIVDLGATITAMAFERTTKISVNRIEAACQGWAEEIFLEVIDSLLDSEKELDDQTALHLINFGHSSGVDTCMGICAAVIHNQAK